MGKAAAGESKATTPQDKRSKLRERIQARHRQNVSDKVKLAMLDMEDAVAIFLNNPIDNNAVLVQNACWAMLESLGITTQAQDVVPKPAQADLTDAL